MSNRGWTSDCRTRINQCPAKEPVLNIVTGLIKRQNLLPILLVLLRTVLFYPVFGLKHLLFPSQECSKQEAWTQDIGPGDTTFLLSYETAHLARLNQKLIILTQKVPQDDESSFTLLQTSWHHKLTEFPGSVWCLQGYRQNLQNSEVWPKRYKNQKTKNI